MEEFEASRPLLFSIAYRMLGSGLEAEDILQEAYLRYQTIPEDEVNSPQALLRTIVTRLCIDQLKSAQARRETYLGPWLPEPVLMNHHPELDNPEKRRIESDSISMAFMVLMESLSPAQRAVFLLREVFDYEYHEIAVTIEKSEDACRQLFSRAKRYIADKRPRYENSPEKHQQMLERFVAVIGGGDFEGLVTILAEDVNMVSDGGGKANAALYPLDGVETVAPFLLGIQKFAPRDGSREVSNVNGKPAIILRNAHGEVTTVVMIEIRDEHIQQIYAISNPDKLKDL